jgi:hypothetical protein
MSWQSAKPTAFTSSRTVAFAPGHGLVDTVAQLLHDHVGLLLARSTSP